MAASRAGAGDLPAAPVTRYNGGLFYERSGAWTERENTEGKP